MPTSGAKVRFSAVLCVLLGCGTSATDRWMAQLNDANPETRRAAARALADDRGSSRMLVEALAAATGNSDVEVREIAVEALGQRGDAAKPALPLLERALSDSEVSVRLKAALAIRHIKPESHSYERVLLDSLRAGHGTVFLEVGRMGPDASWATPALVAALADRRPTIRALAATTLGEIEASGDEVEAALQRAERDPKPAVRQAAQQALVEIETRPSRPVVSSGK
jgi:HEAT repeat protein